jgi:hypothetical protein
LRMWLIQPLFGAVGTPRWHPKKAMLESITRKDETGLYGQSYF